MSDPIPFLTTFSQALATFTLYTDAHPARTSAVQASRDMLEAVLAEPGRVQFSFVGGEVVCGNRVLRELKEWEWAGRLESIGIEWLEFIAPIDADDYLAFLQLVHEGVRAGAAAAAVVPANPPTGIRYGRVVLTGGSLEELAQRAVTAGVAFDLTAEVEGVRWVHERVATSEELPVVETETIVRSLALAMRQQGELILPLLQLHDLDQYATTHSCNVAVLAMGLAEYLGYAAREARALGVAGILADIGNVRVPREVLLKGGALSEEDRTMVEAHCAEGARLILQRHPRMELAAVVAYEHHLDLDGGGYPRLAFPREPHFASRLIRICDFYDAAMSPRGWRPPLGSEVALGLLEAGAGTKFDPDLVGPFSTMLRQARLRPVAIEQPVLEVDGVLPDAPSPDAVP